MRGYTHGAYRLVYPRGWGVSYHAAGVERQVKRYLLWKGEIAGGRLSPGIEMAAVRLEEITVLSRVEALYVT